VEVRLWLDARPLVVRLAAGEDGFAATVDDAAHRVTRVVAGPRTAAAGGTTVEEVALEVDGRPCRAVVARGHDRVTVGFRGRVYVFSTGEETRRAGHAGAASGTVVAPMPGKVVSVLVAVGDAVEAGQPVVVLEAMKMETTLVAEVGGRVLRVDAVAGTTVDGGAPLIEIEPS